VFIDEPKGEQYGGEVAAPPFREIAEYAMKMLGVPPTGPIAPAVAAAPAAREAVAAASEDAEDAEDEDAQDGPAADDDRVAVPALDGLSARAALRRLELQGLAAELRGSGRVSAQSPPAGRVVERGARVRLTLAPPG
jgi:cell division protein FtsI (penicillin-binding protein 3)